MWIFKDDLGCSKLIREYGEYSELELAIMKSYITSESTVLDVGAHIGAFTIPLARIAKKVYAVEPQVEVRQILEKNIELAEVDNVTVLPFALGWKREQRFYNPNALASGSVTMDKTGMQEVDVHPLDALGLAPDFIKIDAEGMDLAILAGGIETIKKYRPYIFAEQPRDQNDFSLINYLGALGYISAPVNLPMYVPNNWNNNPTNHFPGTAHLMVLAVPTAEADELAKQQQGVANG